MNKNPCDLCCKKDCDGCALHVYAAKSECFTSGCFMNQDTMCVCGFYEKCGAWWDGRNKNG